MNIDAARGVVAHALLEACLKTGKAPRQFLNKTFKQEDRAHSDASPSNADRWFNCPGSVNLIRSLRKAGRIVEKKGGVNPSTIKVDVEICDAVEYAIDYIEQTRQEAKTETLKLSSEEYVEIWTLNPPGENGEGGTLDCAVTYYASRTLHIFDFKNGTGPVAAEKNKQMLLYAVGKQALSLYEFKNFVLHIIQPRSKDGVQSSSWEVTADQLAAFEKESRGKFLATLDPNAPRVPGEDQCYWCEGKPFCKEFMDQGLATARTTFEQFTTKKLSEVKRARIEWNVSELKNAYANLWLLEDMIEIIRATVSIAVAGGQGPELGLKLVRGKTNRVWAFDDAKLIKLFRSKGFKEVDYMQPPAVKPITAIEKLYSQKDRKTCMDAITRKPPGAPTIAPLTDPRPAIQRAAEDFKDIL